VIAVLEAAQRSSTMTAQLRVIEARRRERGLTATARGVIGATSWVAVKAVIPAIVASLRPGWWRWRARARTPSWPDGLRTYQSCRPADDPEVEAVYVLLPNSLHRTCGRAPPFAGKHVLCEKPPRPLAADATRWHRERGRRGHAEAYMTPFHPRAAAVDAPVRGGRPATAPPAAFTACLNGPMTTARPDMGGASTPDHAQPLLVAAGRPPVRVEAAA
jgi:hypothetical protein